MADWKLLQFSGTLSPLAVERIVSPEARTNSAS